MMQRHQGPVAPRIARGARRGAVTAVGVITVLAGLVLIPLPGPGTPVVFGGLTLLGKELPAAGRFARRIRTAASGALRRMRRVL